MNRATYAEFLRAAGHRVIETTSALWYDAHPGTLTAFPLHRGIAPEPAELQALLRRALLVRFTSANSGIPSYFVGCDNREYGMASLNSKARNQTRRALERWEVMHKDGAWLAEHGLALNRDTLARQGRPQNSSGDRRWGMCCGAIQGRPGFEVWAAISDSRVGAVALTFVYDDVAYVLVQRSATAELPSYPNNALTFVMTRDLLARPGVRLVFYGMRSLSALESLDHFKAGMGYSQHPIYETFAMSSVFRMALAPARLLIPPLIRHFSSSKAAMLDRIFAACELGPSGARA